MSENASSRVQAKLGMEFVHASWLDGSSNPLRCRVTAVRTGMVYWKALYPDGSVGRGMCCDVEQFPSKVKEITK